MNNYQVILFSILSFILFGLSSKINAQDCNCTIKQGDFIADIEPVTGNETAVEFYQYNTPNGASSNTGFELADAASLFLYQDSNTGIVSLVIIFDDITANGDMDGGAASIDFMCLPETATLDLSDDTNEVTGVPPNLSGGWRWISCCTDGAIIGGIDCNSTLDLEVNIERGIDNFRWLSGSDNVALDPDIISIPSLTDYITISCDTGDDKDGDGIADQMDDDDDNDGILDIDECYGCAPADCETCDTDMDGIPNRLDLDSDNDGISDAVEACGLGTELENDMIDGLKDCFGVITDCMASDSDAGDGGEDPYDVDADNDGCPDFVEANFLISSTDVDECGRVLGMTVTPGTNYWQNPDFSIFGEEDYLQVCGLVPVLVSINTQFDGVWSGGAGWFDNPSGKTTMYNPSTIELNQTVSLFWTFDDYPDCSTELQVTFNEIQEVNFTIAQNNFCAGDSTLITADAGYDNYDWYFYDGTPNPFLFQSGSSNTTHILQEGMYYLEAKNDDEPCAAISENFEIEVIMDFCNIPGISNTKIECQP